MALILLSFMVWFLFTTCAKSVSVKPSGQVVILQPPLEPTQTYGKSHFSPWLHTRQVIISKADKKVYCIVLASFHWVTDVIKETPRRRISSCNALEIQVPLGVDFNIRCQWFDMAIPQATKIQLMHSCAHATDLTHSNGSAEHIFGSFGTYWDKQTQMWKEYLWRKN